MYSSDTFLEFKRFILRITFLINSNALVGCKLFVEELGQVDEPVNVGSESMEESNDEQPNDDQDGKGMQGFIDEQPKKDIDDDPW